MNSEERQLLTDLFERMRAMSHVERDPEAEALIAQAVRASNGEVLLNERIPNSVIEEVIAATS